MKSVYKGKLRITSPTALPHEFWYLRWKDTDGETEGYVRLPEQDALAFIVKIPVSLFFTKGAAQKARKRLADDLKESPRLVRVLRHSVDSAPFVITDSAEALLRAELEAVNAECTRLREAWLTLHMELLPVRANRSELRAELETQRAASEKTEAECVRVHMEMKTLREVIQAACKLTGFPGLSVQQGILEVLKEKKNLQEVYERMYRREGETIADMARIHSDLQRAITFIRDKSPKSARRILECALRETPLRTAGR